MLPRAHETERREIGGFRPWCIGYLVSKGSGEIGIMALIGPPESDARPGIFAGLLAGIS